ncbi:MAG: HNH endonuclease [Oligoflexales bacterium]
MLEKIYLISSRYVENLRRSRFSAKVSTSPEDEVLARSAHQCTYVSPDGKRCQERRRLELEHIRPRGKGGDNTPSNITILCRSHNLYCATLHYGEKKIAKYVPA